MGLARLMLIGAVVPFIAAAAPAPSLGLTLSIDGLRSQRGVVRICLARTPKHFPDCSRDADGRSLSVAAPAAGIVIVEGLSAGDYAVSVVHDENGNQKLDTFVGIPREGVGFSRNPTIRFGAPSFRSAQFTLGGAQPPARQQIHMRYFL